MIGLRNRLSEWLEKGLLKVEGEKGKQMERESCGEKEDELKITAIPAIVIVPPVCIAKLWGSGRY
jgi:hypothetical protein